MGLKASVFVLVVGLILIYIEFNNPSNIIGTTNWPLIIGIGAIVLGLIGVIFSIFSGPKYPPRY